ncbi:hypothetical protein [Oceanobacillus jeddahense]|uniref:hypothetical protein n=1 Tax=Oceanobacillus jeddahense TaxID=1462527 RepID=UPI000693FF41|nr:hypothetical protein [Oceanobacillus jeddahense]
MEVYISRSTGPLGGLSSIKVKVNGEDQGKLKNNDVTVAIAEGDTAEIAVNQSFFRSKPITVSDGDNVEVTLNPKFSPFYIGGVLAIILGGLMKIPLFLVVGMVCLVIVLVMSSNWFVITKK